MMGNFCMTGKSLMYDSSARVPLLIKIPGVTNKKIVIDEPVSNTDLVATILDIMGIEDTNRFQGKTLYPVIKGQHKIKVNDIFIE